MDPPYHVRRIRLRQIRRQRQADRLAADAHGVGIILRAPAEPLLVIGMLGNAEVMDAHADILRRHVPRVLSKLGYTDPLLEIAKQLEEIALDDDYFVSRNLYPNVDFYSGMLLRAIGIPMNMYTVMFAIGRMPGWIAHWKEVRDSDSRIYRPRQIYDGPAARDYVPMHWR